jgi:hypothetical protein
LLNSYLDEELSLRSLASYLKEAEIRLNSLEFSGIKKWHDGQIVKVRVRQLRRSQKQATGQFQYPQTKIGAFTEFGLRVLAENSVLNLQH